MDYRFSELVDINKLKKLFDSLYEVTGIGAGVADINGAVLTKTGWTDLCNIYHRDNPDIVHRCIESSYRVPELVSKGIRGREEYIYYKCKNGLIHAVVPIAIKGKNVAVVYKSQFLLSPPDLDYFEKQADDLDIPQEEYLQEVKKIPIYPKKDMDKFMEFVSYIARLFGEMGYQQLELFREQEKSQIRYEELMGKHEELISMYEEIETMERELNSQVYRIEHQEENLKVSEERYQLAVEGAKDVLWEWDAQTQKITFSDKISQIVGADVNIQNIAFDGLRELIHPESRDRVYESLLEHMEGLIPYFRSEFRLKISTGEYKWVLCHGTAMRNDEGKVLRMAGSVTDISERRKSEDQLRYLAYYDQVTGLPNRSNIREHISHSLFIAQRDNTRGALLFLDIDNFKMINDTFGHSFGDEVLKQLGADLQKKCKGNNVVARFGGDEFVILKPVIEDQKEIYETISDIMHMFSSPMVINNYHVFPTISIGVAVFPKDGNMTELLLKNADIAMYEAKEQGNNTFVFFKPSMNDAVVQRMEMDRDLRNALREDEFELVYQPQVNSKTGRIETVEALIRWNHPHKGIVFPDEFIPFAEDTGLIVSIGEWVIRTACRQNKAWQDKGYDPICVSVNISALQLRRWDFVDLIREILEEVELDPSYLEIEITESKLMESLEDNISILNRLKGMGVRIALDDFGTGYSSLNYLQLLPINNLKIDRSFVNDITNDRNRRYIAEVIIALAHRMNLMVTAEGIETKEQLDMLTSKKCDRLQGYLLSRPLPIDKIDALIRRGRLYLSEL